MRKIVSLLLVPFLVNTFYLSEGYAFVDTSSVKTCHCNHSSHKEIHEEEKSTSSIDSDCHSSKKNEPHRCLCKTSKSKKNSNLKISIPIIFLEVYSFDPLLDVQQVFKASREIEYPGYEIILLKPPRI